LKNLGQIVANIEMFTLGSG